MASPISHSSTNPPSHSHPKEHESQKKDSHRILGGNQQKGWVSCLPESCIPFIQLARLNPPVPVLLIYLPHLYGLLYGAIINEHTFSHIIWTASVLLGGSLFFSNAAHAWDDIVDAPLDALIVRTRHRPIPRKAISVREAILFTFNQALCALAFFLLFPYPESAIYVIPSILATALYPYAKRFTNFPQVVLGATLAWGVFIGALAGGIEFSLESVNRDGAVALVALFFACSLWTVMYDTVYAHLDLQQDLKLGIGSTAVFFGSKTKQFLSVCLAMMLACMITSGQSGGLGFVYHVSAIGGSIGTLGLMVCFVDLQDPASIGWWFMSGFKYVGGAIALGLFGEYMLKVQLLGSIL